MALEEEIWFSSEEEAQDCVKIFKKLNISANMKPRVELETRVILRGLRSNADLELEQQLSVVNAKLLPISPGIKNFTSYFF